jgi:hypothetical protein
VACRRDNVTADAAGRIGIFPLDLPELLHDAEHQNCRLFIHAEHCRVLRRIQVQTDDVGGFRFEIRIVAGQLTPDPMRFQARFFPHPVHRIFADAQMNREFAATSVSIHRLAFPWPSFSNKSLKFAIFGPRDLVRAAVLGRPCFLKIVP